MLFELFDRKMAVALLLCPRLLGLYIVYSVSQQLFRLVYQRKDLAMTLASGRPPSLSPEAVCDLVRRQFNVSAIQDSVKSLPSYEDKNYYLRGKVPDCNYSEFVLKVSNPVYTSFPVVKGLNDLMYHISSKKFKFSTPYPLLSSDGRGILQLASDELSLDTNGLDGVLPNDTAIKQEMKYHLRLLPYIPGELFDHVEKQHLTPQLLNDVGEVLATIDKELKVIELIE